MPEIWGNLPKSQTDNETIEQAIDRIILEHNNDEESHLGVGQSLQSHKASEIIDHLASSIVADKIGDREILPTHTDDFARDTQSPSLETLVSWNKSTGITGGIGHVFFSTGAVISTPRYMYPWYSSVPTWNKNLRAQWAVMHITTTNQIFYTAVGQAYVFGGVTSQGIGFKVVDNTIYAFHSRSVGASNTEYLTALEGVTLTNLNLLRIEFVPDTRIDFYVNNVLKATHESNLPNPAYTAGGTIASVYLINTAAEDKMLIIRRIYYSQEI